MDFIRNDDELETMQRVLTSKYKIHIAIDIMIQYSRANSANLSHKFEKAGFHHILIEKMKKRTTLRLIKGLAQMQSVQAYDVLKSAIASDDFEIKYMSFYALSKLDLNEHQLNEMVHSLIKSEIMRDRIIEVLFNLDLPFEKYMDLLQMQETDIGKIVFMRVIQKNQELLQEQHSDRLLDFLDGSKEVRISAIGTLSSSKNEKYIDIFKIIFEEEKEWEVRSAIAKGLRNFKCESSMDALKRMVYDDAWWVKFNAFESLIYMGIDGVGILIDLSLDRENQKISDLAYYFLNANKEVYNTIKNV
jgi:HEAT repeat protein